MNCYIGYHINSYTDFDEIQQAFNLEVEIQSTLNYEIYLIGGNKASTARGDLLDTIRAAIPKIFKNYQILGERLNLKSEGKYISAGMQMNGELFFCEHDHLK